MVHSEETFLVTYCHSADPSVWYFYRFSGGGGGYGRCAEGTAALPPPDLPLYRLQQPVQPVTVRMFVARISAESKACFRRAAVDCLAVPGAPQPLAVTDADFGFRLFDHTGAPVVLKLFGYDYEALSTKDGKPWIVDRAVLAARGADRLAVRLPDAKHRWLVGVFQQEAPHKEVCTRRHGLDKHEGRNLAQYRAIERTCGTRLRLVVDGRVRSHRGNDDTSYGDPWTYAAPGAHEVTVEVTKGDPRNVRYAVIVWRAGTEAATSRR
jgi:hypothetical protein